MTELSSVRNLQSLDKSQSLQQATRGGVRFLHAKLSQHDLVIVVGFSLIGLLVTLAFIASVPDFVPATTEMILIP
jgi:hypothetical protein